MVYELPLILKDYFEIPRSKADVNFIFYEIADRAVCQILMAQNLGKFSTIQILKCKFNIIQKIIFKNNC